MRVTQEQADTNGASCLFALSRVWPSHFKSFKLKALDETGNWEHLGSSRAFDPWTAALLAFEVKRQNHLHKQLHAMQSVFPWALSLRCVNRISALGVFGRAVGVVLVSKFIISALRQPCFD